MWSELRIKKICCAPGKEIAALFDGSGKIEKSQTSTVSLSILNMGIPRFDQPTYVSPPTIGTSYCHFDSLTLFVRWEMRRRILLLGIRSYSFPPLFTENGEMNWSIHRILGRDWRGSNPQLPPWQGGALTDWTTIPGKLGVQPQNSYSFFLFDFIRTHFRRVVTETRMIYYIILL